MGWKSPGGVKYRAAYTANNIFNLQNEKCIPDLRFCLILVEAGSIFEAVEHHLEARRWSKEALFPRVPSIPVMIGPDT